MNKILLILILWFSTFLPSYVLSAETYNDCILENMSGVGSNVAAKAIKDACKVNHINTIFSICVEKDAKIINDIIYLPNMKDPYEGANSCEYMSGQVKLKGEIKNGKLHGKMTWWYQSGQKALEKNYTNGKLEGKMVWWYDYNEISKLDGQIRVEEYYKDDKKDGKSINRYENGQMSSEIYYKNGIRNGKSTYWYVSGQIWSEKSYKDGKKDGKFTTWSSTNGNIWSVKHYESGKCISGDCNK